MKTVLVDAWNTLFTEYGMFDAMYQLLKSYPNPKIVMTNADDKQMVTLGIDKSPYAVFTLKHNPDKDDPAYFRSLFAEHNLDSNGVVYFEHNLDAVESARSMSIISHHYDKDAKDLSALKNFLDTNL